MSVDEHISVVARDSTPEQLSARVLAELRAHRRVIADYEDFVLEYTIDRLISDIEDPYGESIIPGLLGPHIPVDSNVAS